MGESVASPMRERVGAAMGASRGRREVLVWWVVAFLAFRTLIPLFSRVPSPISRPVLVVLFMLLSLMGPRLLASLSLPLGWRLPLIPLLAALSLVAAAAQTGAAGPTSAALLAGYSDLFLILCAGAVGLTVAGLFREPNILVPVALVSGLVDYWGVNYGTTAQVLQHAPQVVSKLSVQMPVPAASGGVDFSIGIGFGDFVFFTTFLACARRFALRERLTFWLGFAMLLGAMAVVVMADRNIPALAPMAVAFLGANWGRFQLQRGEVQAMGYAALIVAALIGLWMVLRHG
ncbi:MAG: hypothetical protein QHJ73_14275 [Armatimonadota bacterium]|nr:hypothetical protein [Armatimonadota bacterium]